MTKDNQAIKDYYYDMPQGASIPWGVLIEPLGWLFVFIIRDELHVSLHEYNPTSSVFGPRATNLPDGLTAAEHDREGYTNTHHPLLQ